MQTEFYRSTPDFRQTFSLVLVASMVGIGICNHIEKAPSARNQEPVILPACVQNAYYEPAALQSDAAEQVRALQHFAQVLLSETEDNPQPVVDLLNHHFWNLV